MMSRVVLNMIGRESPTHSKQLHDANSMKLVTTWYHRLEVSFSMIVLFAKFICEKVVELKYIVEEVVAVF